VLARKWHLCHDAKARAEALVVLPRPFIATHARRIVDLAAQSRLPAMYPAREMVEPGGLLTHDADRSVDFRRIGPYVDKIFKGAKAGDLPAEQPTKFDSIINKESRLGTRHHDPAVDAAARGQDDSVIDSSGLFAVRTLRATAARQFELLAVRF